jgi:hypothetical protein
MRKYEFRFLDSSGQIGLTKTVTCTDEIAAKANAKTLLATILDFDAVELWSLDRHIETLRRSTS